MKLAVIGFGNAGGKITDHLLEFERATGRSLCRFASAFNTARVDLEKIEYVPEEYRILYGQTDERAKGHGVGADPDLGAEITRADLREIERVLDGVPVYDVDAFLVVAGLGGGTGSGGAPVMATTLAEQFDQPIYGLGVLPSEDEGGRAALNAARSLPTFNEATDALVLFDNDVWREGRDSIESGYERTNREIARRIVTLLGAGEWDGPTVSENAMDASDVKRTLASGGIATIAFAETERSPETDRQTGLLARLQGSTADRPTSDGADPAAKVYGLVQRSVRSRLTCPAEVESAERALVVLSGPPQEFSQKGLERARRWLEGEIDSAEVLAGDDPRDSETLTATVLLSTVTEVPRIRRLQEQAVAAQESIQRQAATREEETATLLTDEEHKLDPV